MQLDVITMDVGEMLADLGDAYGKRHLPPGTMHSSSEDLAPWALAAQDAGVAHVNIVFAAFVQASYLALFSHWPYVFSTARHLCKWQRRTGACRMRQLVNQLVKESKAKTGRLFPCARQTREREREKEREREIYVRIFSVLQPVS
jgi:hypothetical protein